MFFVFSVFIRTRKKNMNQTCFPYFPCSPYFLEQKIVFKNYNQTDPKCSLKTVLIFSIMSSVVNVTSQKSAIDFSLNVWY